MMVVSTNNAARWAAPTALLIAMTGTLCPQSASAAPPAPGTSHPEIIRQTPLGTVAGAEGEYNSYVWYSIPYAKPPVGELRWRAPRPAEPWSGVREATTPLKPCSQLVQYSVAPDYPEPVGSVIGQEDCLYLSVWSPRLKPAEIRSGSTRLPVMVWLHGGGNAFGNGADYQGGHLAASQKVIVVTINYRLSALGWFPDATFTGADGTAEDKSGNYGTLDHIQALKWVRDNISAFGGDPGRVTLFGESGGGNDVRMLLHAPPAAGLFHRAIIESVSSGFSLEPVTQHERLALEPQAIVTSLLIADGQAKDAAEAGQVRARLSAAGMATYLRSKSFAQLAQAMSDANARLDAGHASAKNPNRTEQGPLIRPDGVVISNTWINKVPIINGITHDEDRGFLIDDAKFAARDAAGHRGIKDRARFELLAEYLRKLSQAVANDEAADAYVSHGNTTYAYRFDWQDYLSPDGQNYADLFGASHGTEVRFVMGTTSLGREMAGRARLFDLRDGSSYRQLSDTMMSYWAEFAYTGDPGTGRDHQLPRWERWPASTSQPGRYMIFDAKSAGGTRLATGRLTKAQVLEQLNQDPRLASSATKCRLVTDLRENFLSPLNAEDYKQINADHCAKQ